MFGLGTIAPSDCRTYGQYRTVPSDCRYTIDESSCVYEENEKFLFRILAVIGLIICTVVLSPDISTI